MNKSKAFFWAIIVLFTFANVFLDVTVPPETIKEYDLVILNGRVIDPESGLDQIRNVGISHGQIVAVTGDEIVGDEVIDATGQVVAPGFIDLHAHGQNTIAQTYQLRDGVTTALELEGGKFEFVADMASREGTSLINYGFSAGFGALWLSPFGPLTITYAKPLNEGINDSVSELQFGMGGAF